MVLTAGEESAILSAMQNTARKRIYEAVLEEHLRDNRQMAFLTGPRQCGKTTLAKRLSDRYFTWDDLATRHHGAASRALQAQRARLETPSGGAGPGRSCRQETPPRRSLAACSLRWSPSGTWRGGASVALVVWRQEVWRFLGVGAGGVCKRAARDLVL